MPAILHDLLAAEDPLAARTRHHTPACQARHLLFMSGGVSHVDSFDPKPKLTADNGKT